MYETGGLPIDNYNDKRKYLHNDSIELHSYCNEFCNSTKTINTSLVLMTCKACVNGEHLLIKKEGFNKCVKCNVVYYNYCTANRSEDTMDTNLNSVYYLKCYNNEISNCNDQSFDN